MPDRRRIQFRTFKSLESDLSTRVQDGYDMAGQWDLPGVLTHPTKSMDGTTVENPKGMPRPMRRFARLIVKPIMYRYRRLPSGLPSAKEMLPLEPVPLLSALEQFKSSLDKVKHIPGPRVDHPVFGRISVEDFQQFHLIHAEHHFGFLIPKNS